MYLLLYERINNILFYIYEFPSVVKVVVMIVVTYFALLDILLDFRDLCDPYRGCINPLQPDDTLITQL
jgi:hypothetical protein